MISAKIENPSFKGCMVWNGKPRFRPFSNMYGVAELYQMISQPPDPLGKNQVKTMKCIPVNRLLHRRVCWIMEFWHRRFSVGFDLMIKPRITRIDANGRGALFLVPC
jgi:hypothetical protein